MKILVVDPDPAVCSALSALFARARHQVAAVGTGARALAMGLIHDFDLVICDVVLPDMDGEALIRAIKAQAPQLPVLVTSSASSAEWEKICQDAGAARFLSKPLSPELILREVAMVHRSRLTLEVAWIDPDRIHRTRLSKTLAAIGCHVAPFDSCAEALAERPDVHAFALWVVDAEDPDVLVLLEQVRGGAPVFVFAAHATASGEETLMRAGAALYLRRPIDTAALLTQASFLAR